MRLHWSNFPPGMTRMAWQHIGGEQHYKSCPLHEDYPEPRNRHTECICDDITQAMKDDAAELKAEEGAGRVE